MRSGRPTVMTPEIIALLEEAFLNGASDREAIFQANIGMSTFYEYCQNNTDFAERKEQLKEAVKYRAKLNVARAINDGDKILSQWYLERKAKDEFSTRTEQTGKDGGPIQVEDTEVVKQLTEQLNAIHRGTSVPSDGTPTSAVDTEAQN